MMKKFSVPTDILILTKSIVSSEQQALTVSSACPQNVTSDHLHHLKLISPLRRKCHILTVGRYEKEGSAHTGAFAETHQEAGWE